MAHSRKHSPVPPASCTSSLIRMDVVTFWQRCSEAGERHYSTMCFSTERNQKGKRAACEALAWRGFFTFLLLFFLFIKLLSISKCHVDEHSPGPRFNALQLCTAHWNAVSLCVNERLLLPQLDTLQLYSYDFVMYGCVDAVVTLSASVCLTLLFVVATSQ